MRALALGLALSAMATSCEMSSGLLTESERSSLYALALVSSDGADIADGSVVRPGTPIAVSVTKKSGASDPAVLDFSLSRQDGSSSAGLRFVSATADSSKVKALSAATSKSVPRIEGKLEGFAIPEGLEAGSYQILVAISSPDGSVLQQETIPIFVGLAKPAIDSASVFPPSVEPGASVLLGLTLSWLSLNPADPVAADSQATKDPWVKWSRDGSTFSEGLQSAGFDKVVWTAPRIEGAYSIRAEVFPSAPAKGGSFSFRAAASQELRIMVIPATGGSGGDFADPLAFFSLLKLDGSFDDSGTRPRSVQPVAFGSPSLDTYSSGFGYRFGTRSGVSIPDLMPPSASGRLAAFAVLVRLAPDQADGVIVRFASADSAYALALGLDGGRPYAESLVAGKAQRSIAVASVPRGPLTLEAIFKPTGDSLAVSWRAEGERIEAPSLPLPPAPPAGNATLGGPLSLPGVYDGFGLMIPGSASAYPSPSYRLAARRQWKSSLVIAEGFEDGQAPPASSSSGSLAFTDRGLELGPSASLSLSPDFGIGAGLHFEAGLEGDRGSAFIVFSTPTGGRSFAIRGTGEVSDASGKSIGSLPASEGGLAFSIHQGEGQLSISGKGGVALSLPTTDRRFVLALERSGGTLRSVVDRVLLRYDSMPTSP